MKILSITFILIFVLNAFVLITPQKASAQVSVNFQVFYDNLSPYGDWVFNPEYGYVWVPDVPYGFAPYATNGYWAFTNVGWTWISNYSWGWAPFHYGRWLYDDYYGWLWVPGDEWGPGWVTWRRSDGYYGWAPIGPDISITFAYSSGYRLPYNRWRFVRNRDFGRTNINNYYVNSSNNVTIINNSTVINNIQVDNSRRSKYNAGPSRTEVQQRTGKSIAPIALKERNAPGQNLGSSELQIYRPRVEKNVTTGGRKPAPRTVARKEDVKPVSQRRTSAQPHSGNQQRNSQQAKQQQEQRNNQQGKEKQEQQQRNSQQAKQQQEQQQRNNQQAKQEQQQRNNQKEQHQGSGQPARQQQQQFNNQPAKEQQQQQQRNNQQAKQQQETTTTTRHK